MSYRGKVIHVWLKSLSTNPPLPAPILRRHLETILYNLTQVYGSSRGHDHDIHLRRDAGRTPWRMEIT